MNISNGIPTLQGRLQEVLNALGTREPSTLLQAQAVLEKIRISKGHLDDDVRQDLNNLRPENRALMLGFVERSRETEAAYTTSISDQLYSSKYRFLYEVIQNADDSNYSKAEAQNTAKYIHFRITPNAVVIETNEDGFNRANVEAVCATGKSSKTASVLDDHIGEKGFGFKSVFSIAHEIHIQSGVWSFKFRHREGDNGIGMVTPLDAPQEALPSGVRTRISLRLTDNTPDSYHRLLEAVTEIPETTILFLRRLRELKVTMIRGDGQTEIITIHRQRFDQSSNSYTVVRSSEVSGITSRDVSSYLWFEHIKDRLPQDNRRPGRRSVKIILAFPVDLSNKKPEISVRGQHTFAYLPLQRVSQLQFLIQSDFITVANRESIRDCPWNDTLCTGVAEAFCEIVTRSFANPTHFLRYSWLAYLPTRPMERPWSSLYSRIKDLLKNKSILQTWETRSFKVGSALRQVPGYMLHGINPIMKDLNNEAYLAPEYGTTYSNTLSDLGAVTLTYPEMIDRIQADLVCLFPRLKATLPNDSWHESFAKLGRRILEHSNILCQQRLKKLAIIPLVGNSQWTGAPGIQGGLAQVYFPTSGTIPIPITIQLHLVDGTAASNSERRKFYEAMGVKECPKELVLSKIKERHQAYSGTYKIRKDLTYLFYFHPDWNQIHSWVIVESNTGQILRASDRSFYFPSRNQYDLYKILPEQFRQDTQHQIQFLSQGLIDHVSLHSRIRDMTWKTFLGNITNARYYPPLRTKSNLSGRHELSFALKSVLEHNPKKFLALLKAHWNEYQQEADKVTVDLMICEVPCQSGAFVKLYECYLPTPEILSKTSAMQVLEEKHSILALPCETLTESSVREWNFLERFGVRLKPDLGFYKIAVLFKGLELVGEGVIKEIYTSLAKLAGVQDHEGLRSLFNQHPITWDPQQNCWEDLSKCVWEAPPFMTCKVELKRSYGNSDVLRIFFTRVLDVPNWTTEDVLAELEARRENHETDTQLSLARDMYQFLDANTLNDSGRELLRNSFAEKKLILGENGAWHTLGSCVWESAFALGGFQDLSTIYPDLESFFVRRLGLKKASPSMLINEVKRMANEAQPRIADMKLRLIEIGFMLRKIPITQPIGRALDALRELAFLPKKLADGTLALVRLTDTFAIADHVRYGSALEGHDILLDFGISEVQSLHILFQYFGITGRYLSAVVQEISAVGDDAIEDEDLSKMLQEKSYALYCCAAKCKSAKALQGDRVLFDQLSSAVVYTSNEISTCIVLPISQPPLRVQSDRIFVHHVIFEGHLKIYVPLDQQKRRACYRSQLPKLLASVMEIGESAAFSISSIISSNSRDLDDVVEEQDIPFVDWIERPVIAVPEPQENEQPRTPPQPGRTESLFDESEASTVVGDVSAPSTPTLSPDPVQFTPFGGNRMEPLQTRTPTQYPRLIEQVVQSAQRANERQRDVNVPVANMPPLEPNSLAFDHAATFGIRGLDEFSHDRRIGAAGEAYVFERLSNVHLPNFTLENWRSTIRGELSSSNQYAGMRNWVGRETADIVYADNNGALTEYLREHCTGSFPEEIGADHDHAASPIEYFLEVKSTTERCSTRFFLSRGQYERMGNMAIVQNERPRQVYVIIRVFDLTTPNVGMKIFVDPMKLQGRWIKFEVQQWIGNTL